MIFVRFLLNPSTTKVQNLNNWGWNLATSVRSGGELLGISAA